MKVVAIIAAVCVVCAAGIIGLVCCLMHQSMVDGRIEEEIWRRREREWPSEKE